MYTFKKIEPTEHTWDEIENSQDSTIFHSREWNAYLRKIGITPYIVSVLKNSKIIGYFIGQRLLHCIITAPIEGIGTYTQGLCMKDLISECERVSIYKELAKWLFSNKEALLFQVDDWQLRRTNTTWIPCENFKQETLDKYGLTYSVRPTLCVDVNTSEEEMWANLSYKSCKYCVNKAKKAGLYVKEIRSFEEIDEFTKIHYKQLKEVCARKGMRPKSSQKQKRMKALCESLFPNRVMMLEVVGNDESGREHIMSTAIFGLDKGESIYWTGASFQRYHKYCPNELMVWEAMRYANQRRGGVINFGGCSSYKLKFGTVYEYVPRIYIAKYSFLISVIPTIKKIYYIVRRFIARIVGKRSFK